MKNDHQISAILGLTHEELALLLKVSRPLISLYERGQRSLPLHATQLLTEMLAHVQSKKEVIAPKSAKQLQEQQADLERMRADNEYERRQNERQLNAIAKKDLRRERLALIVDHLETKAKEGTPVSERYRSVGRRARMTLSKDDDTSRLKLQLRQQVLDFEKELLEAELAKISKAMEAI